MMSQTAFRQNVNHPGTYSRQGKLPDILVQQSRLSSKMTNRQLPGKVPIILVVQMRLSRELT